MSEQSLIKSRAKLIFVVDFNEEGVPIFKSKTLNNIKGSASNEEISSTAKALGNLSDYDLDGLERNDISEVTL